jgi:hypothetical protein
MKNGTVRGSNMSFAVIGPIMALGALVLVVILMVWAICKAAAEGYPEDQWYEVIVYLDGEQIARELCTDWDDVEETRAFWPTIFPNCETKVVNYED